MGKDGNNFRESIIQVLLGLTEACKEENEFDLSEFLLFFCRDYR